MKFQDKYKKLNQLLVTTLSEIIDSDYYLLDLPYHSNIGDTLIWQGEEVLLKTLQVKCLGRFSSLTERFIPSPNDILLFHGGGNLGDLYREHIDYLFSLIRRFPKNKIVVFPQTVYYKDMNLFEKDVKILSSCSNLYFCVRDKVGFDLLSSKIKNLYMLPDMAFCIDPTIFEPIHVDKNKGSLLLKRLDQENAKISYSIETDFVKDWPTFYHSLFDGTFIAKCLDNLSKLHIPFVAQAWDWWAYHVYKNDLIKIGVKFVKSYDPIYTTRLHVMILTLLCGKSVNVIDNSYGKNLNFVNTWLQDVDELTIYYEK